MTVLKIAYIIPSLVQTAPMKIVHSCIRQLKHRTEIHLYYLKESSGKKSLEFDLLSQKCSFFNAIDFDNYDIIHSHGVLPDLYVRYHRKKIQKAQTVTTLHNIAHEDFVFHYGAFKASLILRLWRFAIAKFDMVVVLSQYAKEHYHYKWGLKNLVIVHNGIPVKIPNGSTEDLRLLSLKQNYRVVLAVGTLSKLKGFDQVVKALPMLPQTALVLVGEGKERENLKNLAKNLGVKERVCFLGFIENISSLMVLCDLVCIPSRSEGFGLVVLEAMRAKKPIVLSDIPVFRELFDMPRFQLENIEDLAEKIKTVNPNEGEKNYQIFLEKFTDKVMAQNYEKLYWELLND